MRDEFAFARGLLAGLALSSALWAGMYWLVEMALEAAAR